MKGVISLKKRIIPLVLLLAMLLSLPAYAASPRVMTILPAISFDGTTANCRVSVSADRSTDQISAVIQLWNGSTRIARWTDSGTGYLAMFFYLIIKIHGLVNTRWEIISVNS